MNALKGTRQIYGHLWDDAGGACAWGVLYNSGIATLSGGQPEWAMRPVERCHLCGATRQTLHEGMLILNESDLLVHLNNDHKLDFIGIAEKMPQEAV